jgi:hypothetical protein
MQIDCYTVTLLPVKAAIDEHMKKLQVGLTGWHLFSQTTLSIEPASRGAVMLCEISKSLQLALPPCCRNGACSMLTGVQSN